MRSSICCYLVLALGVCINASVCTYWISDGGRKKFLLLRSRSAFVSYPLIMQFITVLFCEDQSVKWLLQRETSNSEGHDVAHVNKPIENDTASNWTTSNGCETHRA